jgi:NAD(P)-dependent dehydrogenase (short-subunit alcohol dehydrogenase family)
MSVLILGATSRIAQQVGHRYAEQGHAVFVAARDDVEAQRIAADIGIRSDVPTASSHFDALDFDGHRAFIDEVESRLGPIEVALIAFGDMGDQAESQVDFKSAHRVIDINYTGAASISEAIAERMEGRERGALIGITSVAGDRGRQSNYFYGSAKGAFTLYLQGLRNRLAKAGVHVMTVRLGFVDTRMTFGMKTGIPIASPEAISLAIREHQARCANDVYLPKFWRGIMGIIKTIPEGVFKRLSL